MKRFRPLLRLFLLVSVSAGLVMAGFLAFVVDDDPQRNPWRETVTLVLFSLFTAAVLFGALMAAACAVTGLHRVVSSLRRRLR